jgi:hypothetical protein
LAKHKQEEKLENLPAGEKNLKQQLITNTAELNKMYLQTFNKGSDTDLLNQNFSLS